MAEYAVHGRGHDAEFLLGIQMKETDRQLQQARKGRGPVNLKSPVRDVGPVAEVSADEAQAAARFVRRRVASEAISEVLQMLGLEAP